MNPEFYILNEVGFFIFHILDKNRPTLIHSDRTNTTVN